MSMQDILGSHLHVGLGQSISHIHVEDMSQTASNRQMKHETAKWYLLRQDLGRVGKIWEGFDCSLLGMSVAERPAARKSLSGAR